MAWSSPSRRSMTHPSPSPNLGPNPSPNPSPSPSPNLTAREGTWYHPNLTRTVTRPRALRSTTIAPSLT